MPDSDAALEPFPVRHVSQVAPRPEEARWLIESLYGLDAVAILGGAPRCGKTWLAAELAFAVASGLPALGRFPVRRPGPVLFYGAEDDQPALRARFESLAVARGAKLEAVSVHLLDVTELRIDRRSHVVRLSRTIASLSPVLVVLDPFVRIARIDENSATEVSAVLGSLRTIQRQHHTGILLAHHTRKSASGHRGFQLRGSGDFAAWSDTGLYLTRRDDAILLNVEHRSAAAPPPLRLRLTQDDAPRLEILDTPSATVEDPLRQALLERLGAGHRPMTTVELRDALRRRKQDVVAVLESLRADGLVIRDEHGWCSRVPSLGHGTPEHPHSGQPLS